MKITKDSIIAEILHENEDLAKHFLALGMHCLGCSMAKGETVGEAAEVHGIDLDKLLEKLNADCGK